MKIWSNLLLRLKPIISIFVLALSLALISKPFRTKSATESQPQVLGETTTASPLSGSQNSPDFSFNIKIPAQFLSNASFEKSLSVLGNLSAPNIIYSVNAGDGISVLAGQNPIIKNTGVLTVQGKSGNLILEAGSGVSVDGLKISNSDTGSSQNIFKTFAVQDNNDIVASSNSDKITFVPGVGITLSSDTTNKKITIGSYAAGWTRTNPYIFLTNSADSVGIGTSEPSSKLHVLGDVKISGGLNLLGSGITNAGAIVDATGLTSSGNITFSGIGQGIVKSNSLGLLSSSSISLASGSSEITGILSIPNGGTGIKDYNKGDLIYSSSSNVLSTLGIGGEGDSLVVSNGVPVWGKATSGSGLCTNCLITNPGSTQTIIATGSAATALSIRQADGGSTDIFNIKNFAGTTTFLKINSDGVFGIGNANSNYTGSLNLATLTANRTYTLPNTSGNICLDTGNCAGVSGNIGGSGTTGYLSRWTSLYGLENSSIFDNGNIGIGTATPSAKLDVVGTGKFSGALDLASTLGVTGSTTLNSTLGVAGAVTMSSTLYVTSNITSGGSLKIDGVGNSYILGNLGIGTTNPGNALDVNGNIRGAFGYLSFLSSNDIPYVQASSGKILRLTANGSTSDTDGITISTTGAVGIGTVTPSAKLDVTHAANTAAFNLTADSVTTATASAFSFDSLTTGTGMLLQSNNTANSSAKILSIEDNQNRTTPSGTTSNLLSLNRNVTYSPSIASITKDNQTETSGYSSSFSLSHNVGNYGNRILLAYITMYKSPTTEYLASVTYGGVAMTQAAAAGSNAGYTNVYLYYLVNPPVGTNTLTANFSYNVNAEVVAVSFYNVDQTTPFGTASTQGSLGGSFSTTLASNANEVITDLWASAWGSGTPNSGQTVLFNGNYARDGFPAGATIKQGSSSVTTGWTGNGSNYGAYLAIPIKPVSVSSFSIAGSLATISSSCSSIASCADTSNLLSLSQLTAAASGGIINIVNAGTGADIVFDTTPILRMANGGTMKWDDGTNTLLSLVDNGTTGTLNVFGAASISGTIALNSANTIDILNGGNLNIRTSPGGDAGLSSKLTLLNNGYLGLGTTNPGSLLDVKGALRLSGSTSGYVGFIASASAGTTTYTLPSKDGGTNQVLSTNGNGVLSWIDLTGGVASAGTGASLSLSQTNITSSRALGTVYQNTTGKPLFVTVSVTRNQTGTLIVSIDSNSAPTTQIVATSDSSGWMSTVSFFVVPGNYYKVTTDAGASLFVWNESSLEISGVSQWTALNSNLYYNTGNVGINVSTPSAKLHVAANYGANSAVIFDQLNSGDLFSASASGTTKLTIAHNGLLNATLGGLATLTKAGTISDTDFSDKAIDGTLAVDSADSRLYVRSGSAWKYIAFTGGFQIPDYEATNFSEGDLLLPYVEKKMADGAIHGLYMKLSDAPELATLSATISDKASQSDFRLLSSITEGLKDLIHGIQDQINGILARLDNLEKKSAEPLTQICLGTPGQQTCVTKDQLDALIKTIPTPQASSSADTATASATISASLNSSSSTSSSNITE